MPTVSRNRRIPLLPSRTCRGEKPNDFARSMPWQSAPPFVVNKRGVLTHRVRHVTAIFYGDEVHHRHADYLCGNGCNIDLEDIDTTLVFDPPKDRLLCSFCEAKAEREQLPNGDTLAGRHVHRGVLVARRVCCLKPGEEHAD